MEGIIYIEIFISDVLLTSQPSPTSHVLGISQEESPYGLSYEDHITSFWKWILSLPREINPWWDEQGDVCTCAQGSVSPVFYLAGNGGRTSYRTHTVPLGKGLLIPLMVVEVSEMDFKGKPSQELAQIAKKDQDSVTELYLKIDNKEYPREELLGFRRSTKPFRVAFPDNGIFGATRDIVDAVADGYYIITTPLPSGRHTIHYRSRLDCKGDHCLESKPFIQDITCTIN